MLARSLLRIFLSLRSDLSRRCCFLASQSAQYLSILRFWLPLASTSMRILRMAMRRVRERAEMRAASTQNFWSSLSLDSARSWQMRKTIQRRKSSWLKMMWKLWRAWLQGRQARMTRKQAKLQATKLVRSYWKRSEKLKKTRLTRMLMMQTTMYWFQTLQKTDFTLCRRLKKISRKTVVAVSHTNRIDSSELLTSSNRDRPSLFRYSCASTAKKHWKQQPTTSGKKAMEYTYSFFFSQSRAKASCQSFSPSPSPSRSWALRFLARRRPMKRKRRTSSRVPVMQQLPTKVQANMRLWKMSPSLMLFFWLKQRSGQLEENRSDCTELMKRSSQLTWQMHEKNTNWKMWIVSTPIILCAQDPTTKTATATSDSAFRQSSMKSYSGNLVKTSMGEFMDWMLKTLETGLWMTMVSLNLSVMFISFSSMSCRNRTFSRSTPFAYSTSGTSVSALQLMLVDDPKFILFRFWIAGVTLKMKYPAFSQVSRQLSTSRISANCALQAQTDCKSSVVLHSQDFSTWQSDEQPSPETWLPSSHCSIPNSSPFPQTVTQMPFNREQPDLQRQLPFPSVWKCWEKLQLKHRGTPWMSSAVMQPGTSMQTLVTTEYPAGQAHIWLELRVKPGLHVWQMPLSSTLEQAITVVHPPVTRLPKLQRQVLEMESQNELTPQSVHSISLLHASQQGMQVLQQSHLESGLQQKASELQSTTQSTWYSPQIPPPLASLELMLPELLLQATIIVLVEESVPAFIPLNPIEQLRLISDPQKLGMEKLALEQAERYELATARKLPETWKPVIANSECPTRRASLLMAIAIMEQRLREEPASTEMMTLNWSLPAVQVARGARSSPAMPLGWQESKQLMKFLSSKLALERVMPAVSVKVS